MNKPEQAGVGWDVVDGEAQDKGGAKVEVESKEVPQTAMERNAAAGREVMARVSARFSGVKERISSGLRKMGNKIGEYALAAVGAPVRAGRAAAEAVGNARDAVVEGGYAAVGAVARGGIEMAQKAKSAYEGIAEKGRARYEALNARATLAWEGLRSRVSAARAKRYEAIVRMYAGLAAVERRTEAQSLEKIARARQVLKDARARYQPSRGPEAVAQAA